MDQALKDLLPEVRIWLRKIRTTLLDDEILQTMEAALDDMGRAGVRMPRYRLKEGSIKQAIKLYCKANCGYGDPEGKWQERYEKLRDSLAQGEGYGGRN